MKIKFCLSIANDVKLEILMDNNKGINSIMLDRTSCIQNLFPPVPLAEAERCIKPKVDMKKIIVVITNTPQQNEDLKNLLNSKENKL